jgi:hypothetical protein
MVESKRDTVVAFILPTVALIGDLGLVFGGRLRDCD